MDGNEDNCNVLHSISPEFLNDFGEVFLEGFVYKDSNCIVSI